jgi:uncharacterized protein (DUF1697 family)
MRYIALFRGINVGGRNAVKMQALRQMLAGLGYAGARTCLQSGNAVFDASGEPDAIKERIQAAFAGEFGFESAVVVRSAEEISAIANARPFSQAELDAAAAANPGVEHAYVYFMDSAPPPAAVEALAAKHGGPDRLLAGAGGRELHLLCHGSVRDSKLAAALAKLGTPMTARNWKTLDRLRAMAEA